MSCPHCHGDQHDGSFHGRYAEDGPVMCAETEVIERVELPVDRRLRTWSWVFAFLMVTALGVIAGALAAGYR